MSRAKTAAPIEMPFGLTTRVGPAPREPLLDGVQIPGPPAHGKGNFEGKGASHCRVYIGHSAVICAKTAKLTEMPFGLWTQIGQRIMC